MLVHGFASSFEHNWRKTGWVDILSDLGRPVFGPDLLGHGSADRPTDPASYDAVPAGVVAALPPDGPVDAIGFSAGARVLLTVAAAEPHRFTRLAFLGLGDDDVFGDGRGSTEAVALTLQAGPEGDDVRATLFARLARSAGNEPAPLAAFLRRSRDPLDEQRLAAIECPVLIVLGEHDDIAPSADRLLGALPQAQLVTVPGVDHFALVKDFGAIDAVVRFLEGSLA